MSRHHRSQLAATLAFAILASACASDAKRGGGGSGGSGGEGDSSAPSSGPLSGAGTSGCADACERAQACDNNSTVDCAKECAELEDTVVNAGCPDVLDDLVACLQKQPDVCNATSMCEAELQHYIDCLGPYCQKNPMDPGCASSATSSSSAAASSGTG